MTEIAVRSPFPKLRRSRSFLFSWPLWALVALLLLCQATIWWQPDSPRLAVLEQFAVQLSGIAALAAMLALFSRRWARSLVLAVLAMTFAWPVFAYRGEASLAVGTPGLRVLSANLWYSATDHQRTIDALMASDATLIGLVEVSPEWERALKPLFSKYPYRVDCLANPYCETMVLSKVPILKPYAGRVWRTTPMIAGGEVSWQGKRFTVLATHITRPLARSDESRWGASDPARASYLRGPMPANRQSGQAGNLARFLNTLPQDLILMGDLNGTPWSRVQGAFRQVTGLDNRAGWQPTWPSWLPMPLRLAIDHILTRGHLVVTRFAAGPTTDSDHLPVIAEIIWRD